MLTKFVHARGSNLRDFNFQPMGFSAHHDVVVDRITAKQFMWLR